MNVTLLAATLAFGILEHPPQAPSSEPPKRPYLQAGLLMAAQPAGPEVRRYHGTLSGRAIGFTVSAGKPITPVIALEGEFAFGGTVSGPQIFDYQERRESFTAENRDILINMLVRVRPYQNPYIDVVVGGGGVVSTGRQHSIVSVRTNQSWPDQTSKHVGMTLTVGVDGHLRAGPSLTVVPTFRLRLIDRPDDGVIAYSAVAGRAFHAGVGLRFGS